MRRVDTAAALDLLLASCTNSAEDLESEVAELKQQIKGGE